MKLLPKQSVCPYCNTVYRYADLKKIKLKKEISCYHCNKKLTVSKKGWLWLCLELLLIYAVMNITAIGIIGRVTFLSLFIMNLAPAIAAVIIYPLYIELKKLKERQR